MKFFIYDFRQLKTTQQIIREINQIAGGTSSYDKAEEMMVFVVVPALALEGVLAGVDRHEVKVGVHNLTLEDIAGENTLLMLEATGVDMIVLGATDRRTMLGEADADIGKKHRAVLQQGLKSMLCVGETSSEEDARYESILTEQIKVGFTDIPQDAYYRTGAVYQPYWAGGAAGHNVEVGYLEKRVACIRQALAQVLPDASEPLPVFFSCGAMDRGEVIALLKSDLLDGIFIDDRFWTPEEFIETIHEAL